MKRSDERKLMEIVVRTVRSGEVAIISDAAIEAAGGLEEYARLMILAAVAKDERSLLRVARDMQMSTDMADQIPIPGMEYATLPPMIRVRDAETNDVALAPRSLCTLAQVKSEVDAMRGKVNTSDRIVGGYEATIAAIEKRDYTPDQLMGDIERSLRSIEGSELVPIEASP